MSSQERSSPSNGIWLCANCARRIDVDSERFPRELLIAWKIQAEREAHQLLGKPRSAPMELQEEQPDTAFICPHCQSEFTCEQTVCRGCHGQIVLGATKDERKVAMAAGVMLVLFPVLNLYHRFEVKLIDASGGLFNNLPLFFLAALCIGVGGCAVFVMEKLRRKDNPRVFVRTVV